MKKTFLGLLALGAVSSAGADSFGGHIGTTAGVHYQTDLTADSAVRYGLNLSATRLFRGEFGVGGEVAYLRDATGQDLGGLTPYYGFGLGVGAAVGSRIGVSAYPHVLGGLNYTVAGPFSVFVEGNVGPTIAVATSGTGIGFGGGVRLGLNYELR